MVFTTKASVATFGGTLLKLSHPSSSTGTDMAVNVFIPGPPGTPTAPSLQPAPTVSTARTKFPVLVYLSGLSCSPDNCSEKGFLHAAAAAQQIAVVYPDTSPRGLSEADIPDLRTDWSFGEAAGFYLDATNPPYDKNFKMESYITQELPALLWGEQRGQFRDVLDGTRVAIAGHSMGGHGALTLYLKNPSAYRSVSAWAPVANPSKCAWGERAFSGYLGENSRENWGNHDATELVRGWKGPLNCLIDQGLSDNFYKQGLLLPESFEAAAKEGPVEGLVVRYHEGYDHSYYFISTFASDHIAHAAKFLKD